MLSVALRFGLVQALLVVAAGVGPIVVSSSSECTSPPTAPCVEPVDEPPVAKIDHGRAGGLPARRLIESAGLYAETIERRGAGDDNYSPGWMIRNWNQIDSAVGHTVADEVSLQLDKMRELGINTITWELRTVDDPNSAGSVTPPVCNEAAGIGFQFPRPTAVELANLPGFFDLLRSKGMKIWLRLVNTHMEQQPPTNSQTWLGAIFGAIGRHPALDLIAFDGTPNTVGSGANLICGIPAEPPLDFGPGSAPATYIQWAIGFAISQGIPASKLSAEAIVGNYFWEHQAPDFVDGSTDGHFWSPIQVEKGIFDALGIPANQRTYALSFYEQRRCTNAASWQNCVDGDPHSYAEETLQYVRSVAEPEARILAPEMGILPPVDPSAWNTQHALESLLFLMNRYGIAGGSFYRWVNNLFSEDSDPTYPAAVKLRGVAFNYTPVKNEVVDMGGVHLPVLPNNSFEGDAVAGVPADWTSTGDGEVSRYPLGTEAGQPEVPSRGIYSMRIVTGTGINAAVSATSARVAAAPATMYTTTSNCRFSWTGDPNPNGLADSRPQVFISVLYLDQNGKPSAVRASDTFRFFQENSTSGFATFPVVYTTPADVAFVEFQFGARRNGLPGAITFDVDNVR